MRNDHLGFLPEHLLTVEVPVRGPRADKAAREALAADVTGYLRRIPGAQAVLRTECAPTSGGSGLRTFSRSDRPMPTAFNLGNDIVLCRTDDEYTKAVGTRVLRGRYFNQDDLAHPDTTAVINESAARLYFPGENPLGAQILGQQGNWRKVVGVIADSKNQGLKQLRCPKRFSTTWPPRIASIRSEAGRCLDARGRRDRARFGCKRGQSGAGQAGLEPRSGAGAARGIRPAHRSECLRADGALSRNAVFRPLRRIRQGVSRS